MTEPSAAEAHTTESSGLLAAATTSLTKELPTTYMSLEGDSSVSIPRDSAESEGNDSVRNAIDPSHPPDRNRTLLYAGTFGPGPKNLAYLYTDAIHLYAASHRSTLKSLEDVASVEVLATSDGEGSTKSYELVLISFPKAGKKPSSQESVDLLTASSEDEAYQWASLVTKALAWPNAPLGTLAPPSKVAASSDAADSTKQNQQQEQLQQLREQKEEGMDARVHRRNVLFFVNPAGGSGKAEAIMATVKAMIDKTDISYTIIVTKRQNHAHDFVKHELVPGVYDTIATVSGDGLLAEILNGLLLRRDWRRILETTAFAHLPGGSGNGLSTSVAHASEEHIGVERAALLIIKGVTRQVDLFTFAQPNEPLRCGFLSITWGVAADVDIESEKWRCCGNNRFCMSGLVRGCCLRKYKAVMEFLPMDASLYSKASPAASESSFARDVESKSSASPDGARVSTSSHAVNKQEKITIGKKYDKCGPQHLCPVCSAKSATEMKELEHYVSMNLPRAFVVEGKGRSVSHAQSTSGATKPALALGESKEDGVDVVDTATAPATEAPVAEKAVSLSPTPNAARPDGGIFIPIVADDASAISPFPPHPPAQAAAAGEKWVRVDDDAFTMVIASNTAHLGITTQGSPASHLRDGALDLMYSLDVNPCSMTLGILDGLSDGSHFTHDKVHSVKVRGLRLDPSRTGHPTVIALDGERVPCKPFEARTFQGVLKIICK